MKRFPSAASIMFIAAMSVAVAAIIFGARTSQDARRHVVVLSSLDRLVAAETSLDCDLLEIVAGLLPHYDTIVDLSRVLDSIYAEIATDEENFSADLRDEYRSLLQEKLLAAEQIKGLSAFVSNEESYLPFELARYAQSRRQDSRRQDSGRQDSGRLDMEHQDVVRDLQHLLILQLGDHVRGTPLSEGNATLQRLEARVDVQDQELVNILAHFRQLRQQHSRLHEAVGTFLEIGSRAAVERLRGHYMKVYNERKDRALLITQSLTVLTIALFIGLGWSMGRLGKAHAFAEHASARLLDAVASLPEGFALFDSDDRLVMTNPSYDSLMGGNHQSGYGGLIAALQKKDGAAGLVDSKTDQEQILHSDEGWLLFRSRATGDGGVVCLMMDMTNHKRLEDELHKLSAVVEQSPLTIVITDDQGLIEYVNPSFTRLTGYAADEVIGQNSRILRSGETPAETFVEMWKTISAGMAWRGELVNLKKNGELIIENTLIFPIHGDNDRVRHYIGLKENVTLLRKNADLVVDAKADTERLLFAASHDLQEPVRDIILHIQLLERRLGESASGEVSECLEMIRRGGLQLRMLVKGLLDYNRSSRTLSALGGVDCGLIVERVITEIGSACGISPAAFTVGKLPKVQGDPVLLSMLFENLMGNAVKFARPDTAPLISVSAEAEAGGWRIDVADNGIGIESQYLKTVIRPFSRLHSRADFAGAGLGLAAAARIAALHDGRLWLSSEFGSGTTAHVWLPAQDGAV